MKIKDFVRLGKKASPIVIVNRRKVTDCPNNETLCDDCEYCKWDDETATNYCTNKKTFTEDWMKFRGAVNEIPISLAEETIKSIEVADMPAKFYKKFYAHFCIKLVY